MVVFILELRQKEKIKEATLFSIPRNIENNVFDFLLLSKGELIFQSKIFIIFIDFFFNFTDQSVRVRVRIGPPHPLRLV
jgi:hypothetical protein